MADDEASAEAFQRWRDTVQRALWDCFGMTAQTFARTYHGPELRRWFADPARPKVTSAQAAAVMIRFYTSRQWEPFPTPGPDAVAWWARTIAEHDGKPACLPGRLHEADEPAKIDPAAVTDPGPMEL